ncbi:doublecortin domain-containing protein 2C isoform X3 [Dipodomys merriami]|uniref:doublecortin domain-containing protein 2C isoform X3 n=1 Tax=Dipodomys merriami TaxID=94247 RepID=UPI0038557108
MGTRGPYALVDTTPAKTILVYRNGDQFFVGRKFVFSRRRVANFEALLEQLTEQVEVPFGVRRLYTPSRGHMVRELDALQAGGKYVAAGRERFKKLDYIHIVPRKPTKMRKLKEIKPVVHCDINVPSRWQMHHRISRHINVFTNGRLFIPPVKVIIPKFSLSDWNCVLATVGEKVFPLGGVRKLYTLTGQLLGSSQDLQDNQFYVAVGLEPFKSVSYWSSPRVPSEVQQRYMDVEKLLPRKKKVDAKEKELPQSDKALPKTQESVYYAKEDKKKKSLSEPLEETGAEGDVYKAQTPTKDTQGALDVREDPEVKVEVPEDQGDNSTVSFKKKFPLRHNSKKTDKRLINWIPQILKCEGGLGTPPEGKCVWASDHHLVTRKGPPRHHKCKTMLRTATWRRGAHVLSQPPKALVVVLDLLLRGCADPDRSQGFHVLRASLPNLNENKKVVSLPEKEQHDIVEEETTAPLPESPVKTEDHSHPAMAPHSQDKSSQIQEEQTPSPDSSLGQTSPEQPLQDETPEPRGSLGQSSLRQPSPEETPEEPVSPEELSLRQTL